MFFSDVLDRTIGFFSPRTEYQRLQARQAIALVRGVQKRSYDGARPKRRGFLWGRGTSANTEIASALAPLRDQARDLVRNTPYGERIVQTITTHLVGTGIMPVSRTGIQKLDRKVNDLFSAWSDTCLLSGELDFYGIQALLSRSIVESGEALVRFIYRSPDVSLPVPLQLSLMEGDFIDEAKTSFGRNAAKTATLGIEFDAFGVRLGYWLHPTHPGESLQQSSGQSIFVPAKDMCHIFRPLRIGQIRGVSWFAPVLLTVRDLADYLETSLVKAKTEACFAGFIKSLDPGMPGNLATLNTKKEKDFGQELELSPGLVSRLDPGEDVVFAQPSSSQSFEPYVLQAAMAIATGTGITYDQLTGDLRQANYSSLRAGKIEFRGLIRQLQYHMMIRMFCRPLWERFIETAILSGKLPRRGQGYPVSWIAPGFEPIDPLKDLKADILAVRSGRSTWAEFVAEWGNDPEQQLQDIHEFNQKTDALGVILDCDPRRAMNAGSPIK